jgi:PAS domain S-box-containing protein
MSDIVIDQRGRIEALNPAAERLFGYTEQEAIGQNVSMLMPSPSYSNRVAKPADQQCARHGRPVRAARHSERVRGAVFSCLHRSWPRYSTRNSREDLHTVLHDERERNGLGLPTAKRLVEAQPLTRVLLEMRGRDIYAIGVEERMT